MDTYHDIYAMLQTLRIVDTHEHLPDECECLAHALDPLGILLGGYSGSDALAAGLPLERLQQARDTEYGSLRERWAIIAPVWPFICTTGYARALRITLREHYGIEDVSAESLERWGEALQREHRPGLYQRLLSERCGIDYALRVIEHVAHPAEAPLVDVGFFDWMLHIRTLEALEAFGARVEVSIHRLADMEEAVTRQIRRYREQGCVALKLGMAYFRSLAFARTTPQAAEEALSLIFATPKRPIFYPHQRSMEELRPLQDYLLRHIVQCAEALELPIQVHTGFLEGYGNTIANANPALLTDLFIEFPRVRFVLFHLGYPYTGEVTVLAKTFANVFVDFCWNHVAQPSVARRTLAEMLDTIPNNKLFGFGGDYGNAVNVYGHLALARQNLARVLADKVSEGFYTLDEAHYLARRLLRENALEFYKLTV